MDLWQSRTEALAYLNSEHPSRIRLVEDIFATMDRCVDAYESSAESDRYAEICGLTLLKAKHLGVGAYSLVLDGLAQESGALLRPFIEYTELLTYFRKFPEMVHRAAENDLPKAGERAQAIQGMFQDFRQYLNEHASHSSYSRHSLAHLKEPSSGRFKKLQRMVPHVIDRNMRDVIWHLFFLLREGVLGLETIQPSSFEALAWPTDVLKARLVREFPLDDG